MRDTRRGHIEREEGSLRVPAIVQEEGRVTSGRVDFVVNRKFSICNPLGPVMLMFAAEDAKVLFQFLIRTFSLAIGLGVVGGGKIFGDTKERVEGPGERRYELGAAVGNDTRGKTKVLPDMVMVLPGSHFRGNCLVARDEVDHLGQAINANHQ